MCYILDVMQYAMNLLWSELVLNSIAQYTDWQIT
jgi:hypothetical protein